MAISNTLCKIVCSTFANSISETGTQVGSQQLKQILTQKNLPWSNHRSVVVVDSDYSAKTFLSEQSQHPNLVVVTRVRSNRVFYQSPEISSHLITDALICPYRIGERVRALKLLRSVSESMLLMWDARIAFLSNG